MARDDLNDDLKKRKVVDLGVLKAFEWMEMLLQLVALDHHKYLQAPFWSSKSVKMVNDFGGCSWLGYEGWESFLN